jgi:hypothetical protein
VIARILADATSLRRSVANLIKKRSEELALKNVAL